MRRRSIVFPFVMTAILGSWQPASSSEMTLPDTIIVTVNGESLTAGEILVPEGPSLGRWWFGDSDPESQQVIKQALARRWRDAVDRNLLKQVLDESKRAGDQAKRLAIQAVERELTPRVREEISRQFQLTSWTQENEAVTPFVIDWSDACIAAWIVAYVYERSWVERAPVELLRKYWGSRRDEFEVIRRVQHQEWHISRGSRMHQAVVRMLNEGRSLEHTHALLNTDTDNSLNVVESEYPHLNVDRAIIKKLDRMRPGQWSFVDTATKRVYFEIEEIQVEQGEFFEVASEVKVSLAKQRAEQNWRQLAARKRATAAIDLIVDFNK